MIPCVSPTHDSAPFRTYNLYPKIVKVSVILFSSVMTVRGGLGGWKNVVKQWASGGRICVDVGGHFLREDRYFLAVRHNA